MLKFTSRKPLTAEEEFVPQSYLFITAGTFQKRPFIAGLKNKEMLLESLDFNCFKWEWRLIAYVVLDNHYHLVVQTPAGDHFRLAHIIQSAHSFSAYHWRRDDPSIRTRIWWNFWETPLSDREMLIQHVNYVHQNPSFHGVTDDNAGYPFSSYPAYLEGDKATIHEWERKYPPQRMHLIDSF